MLGREDYLDAARECAEFVLGSLRDDDGRLLRTYKDGDARLNAYLEDHAFLLEALLTLYEASFERALVRARPARSPTTMIARFGDPERGGFFSTSADHEELIARRKEIGDHPIPSGNSAAALGLLRLAALSGERELRDARPRASSRLFARTATEHPETFAHLLARARLPPRPDQGGGPGRRGRSASWPRSSAPPSAPTWSSPAAPRAASSRRCCAAAPLVDGQPAAYVCENFACQLPVTEPDGRWTAAR